MENNNRVDEKFQLGKAGEHLVCFDLFSKGLNVSMASETLPYDLLVDNGKNILKVQVKTTRTHKKTNQWRGINNAYVFSIKRKGANGAKKYQNNEVDVFAIVAIDTQQVGYILNDEMPTTINIRPDKFKGMYHDEKGIINEERIKELFNSGLSVKQIVDQTGLKETSVRNYIKNDFVKFKTKARYMSDFNRDKEWFLNIKL